MFRATPEEFERMVEEGWRAIPEKFRGKMRNVEIVIAENPSPEQLEENGIPEGDTLLGLFEGLTAGEQGAAPWELPCIITVFKGPSEEEARDRRELEEVVRETIWHEVAHYFGMEEDEVLSAEDRRRKKREA